jgi:hypothetical protein
VAGTTGKIVTNLHHSWPKFLGGNPGQALTEMSEASHKLLHKMLNRYLSKITKNGKSMAPSRSNAGNIIRENFSPAEIQKALSDFYKGPGKRFQKAATDFFDQIFK